MNRFFFIAIGLFVVMLSACRSTRQVSTSSTTDNTVIEIKDVEKVVHIDGDTVSITMQASTSSANGALISGTLPEREAVEGSRPVTFIPQMQVIESKRTKVTIELTKSGEIKATAISKDIDEKVTVQEKTITTSKSAVTVVEKKESWFKRTLRQAKGVVKTILISAFIVSLIYLFFRFKSKITGFLKL